MEFAEADNEAVEDHTDDSPRMQTFSRSQRGVMHEGMLDPLILDGIIRRIVRVAEPERINLFGSAVRGEMNRHSDVDLLLSKKACTDGIWPDESTKISGG